MDRVPVPVKRRRVLEAAIRAIDLLVYFAVLSGGVYALVAAPAAVTEGLRGSGWLVVPWAILLMGGGGVGFFGRMSGRWLMEAPATLAALTGISIYFLIMVPYVAGNIAAAVAATLVFVAGAFMARRWVELQIFGSEPGQGWRHRLSQAFTRKTSRVVDHS